MFLTGKTGPSVQPMALPAEGTTSEAHQRSDLGNLYNIRPTMEQITSQNAHNRNFEPWHVAPFQLNRQIGTSVATKNQQSQGTHSQTSSPTILSKQSAPTNRQQTNHAVSYRLASSERRNVVEQNTSTTYSKNSSMTASHQKNMEPVVLPSPPVFSRPPHPSNSMRKSNQEANSQVEETPPHSEESNRISYPQLRQPKSLGSSPASTTKLQLFNDDDEIISKKTPFKQSSESTVLMQLKSQFRIVRLGPNTVLPAMCSIQTQGRQRTSTDLICVIDTSGSMAGTKINLVIDTLLYLLQLLNEYDRLCLITFNSSAQRLCALKTVTPSNKPYLTSLIKEMCVEGNTNIMEGLNLALKILKQRKLVNTVSSVFLLSDGQDPKALELFQKTLMDASTGIYSLHSFGFGDDHDPNLMTEIAKIKQGNFYYIPELDKIDRAFVNALGALFSIAAEKVTVRLSLVVSGKFSSIHISKMYGDLWKWNGKEYVLELTQLISDVSKDFVFELNIPACAFELGDFERNQTILKATFEAVTPSKEIIIGGSQLSLTFFNHYESLAVREEDAEVVQNHLRVRAAECMQACINLANGKKYREARDQLLRMADEIRSNKRVNQNKMKGLLEDLRKASESCVEHRYESSGTHLLNCVKYQHMAQNNIGYSNLVQTQMGTELEQLKQRSQ